MTLVRYRAVITADTPEVCIALDGMVFQEDEAPTLPLCEGDFGVLEPVELECPESE